MERAARETADFPAAMMALKRAAAPNGRQSAWARRHRTTAKSRAATTMHAASGQADEGPERRPSSAVIASQSLRARSLRPGPRVRFARGTYGRRWTRVIALHSCKLFSQTRELFIRALDLFVGVREPFIGARNVGHRGVQFLSESGVEFIGVSLFRPMSSEGSRSTSRPHPSFFQRMAV